MKPLIRCVTCLNFARLCVTNCLVYWLFSGSLAALYKDINVVEPSLLNCLEPLESQQVLKLLRMLGVHELEPQQLLGEHIYPTIQSKKWKVHTLYAHFYSIICAFASVA